MVSNLERVYSVKKYSIHFILEQKMQIMGSLVICNSMEVKSMEVKIQNRSVLCLKQLCSQELWDIIGILFL